MNKKNGILIFNNGGIDLGLISALLEAEDCTVYVTSLPLEAIHILRSSNIDVILASSRLEGMEGQEFKELAQKICPGVSIFLLPETVTDAGGSSRELPTECTLNLQEFVAFIQNHIRNESNLLEESSQFKEFFFAFTDRLLQIFDVRDRYFFNNDHLVADLSRRIALKMGLEERLVDAIHLAALLRDIGKIGIQQDILNGKARLESGALDKMKCHPLNTVQILKQIKFPWNVEAIIRHHHEHYDGSGYPDGIKGRLIPLGSRIIAMADSYVAMTTDRPYRKALASAVAAAEIMKLAGSQFDPEVVELFFAVLRQQKAQGGDKPVLLLIEADESVAAYQRLNLANDDYRLLVVGSVAEAGEVLSDRLPELVLVEQHLLESDNFSFYTSARRREVPFLVLLEDPEQTVLHADDLVSFVVKPVETDELVRRIKSFIRQEKGEKGPAIGEEPLRGVSGSLADMGITDIVQVLNMGMKTARVIVSRENAKGEIFLRCGRIVYVEQGALSGNEAFNELVGWTTGEFRVFHGVVTEKVNVTMETITLLLEATKALDERRYQQRQEGAHQ